MPPCFNPVTTSRHNERIIHPESFNRGTANRCQTDEVHPILAPAEMLMPRLCTGIKQRHVFVGYWVEAMRLAPFVAVAPSASQAQITLV
jgi:hypothetical protein